MYKLQYKGKNDLPNQIDKCQLISPLEGAMGVCGGGQTLGHRVCGPETSGDERSHSSEAGQESSASGDP